MFFFFKQKTAYEMRISDWSSDVCSSDLQYMLWSMRAGRPFLRTFLRGGPDPASEQDERNPSFEAPLARQAEAAVWGVTVPWTLLVSCAIGAWLMFSRAV